MKRKIIKLLAGGLLLVSVPWIPVQAETVAINKVKGGVRGIDNGTLKNGDGTNGAEVRLLVHQLKLLKQARTMKGNLLGASDSVARGQRIYFVFIIENNIEAVLEDIRLLDDFKESQFDYVPGTLEVAFVENNATTFTKGADDPFWENEAGWMKVTDGIDSDIASIRTDQLEGLRQYSVQVGKSPNLKPLDIPAKTTWALRFQVKVRGIGQ